MNNAFCESEQNSSCLESKRQAWIENLSAYSTMKLITSIGDNGKSGKLFFLFIKPTK